MRDVSSRSPTSLLVPSWPRTEWTWSIQRVLEWLAPWLKTVEDMCEVEHPRVKLRTASLAPSSITPATSWRTQFMGKCQSPTSVLISLSLQAMARLTEFQATLRHSLMHRMTNTMKRSNLRSSASRPTKGSKFVAHSTHLFPWNSRGSQRTRLSLSTARRRKLKRFSPSVW